MELVEKIKIFKMTQEELKEYLYGRLTAVYGEKYVVKEDGFLYAKGTHPVLLVAHMDTVHRQTPKEIFINLEQTKILSSEGIGGDDRCGVIIILDIIEKIKCSVVFTEDEEIGGLGATKFGSMDFKLNANYVVEFDRKGDNDYVFYKDYNEDFENHIKKFGFVKAYGSYSDITEIAVDYKIEAVNLSSGYYNPHTTSEYVDFSVMDDITHRAMQMIETPTEKFEYVEDSPKIVQTYHSGDSLKYSSWYGSSYYKKKVESVKVYGGQARLIINGKRQKFSEAILHSDGRITDIKRGRHNVKLNKNDKAEFWSNKYDFPISIWTFENNYPKQILKYEEPTTYRDYANTPTKKIKQCYICGDDIEDDDELGNMYGLCENCYAQYYGDYDYFGNDYLYD